MIEQLTKIQFDKGYSDQEFATLLGLKSRQAWGYIRQHKRGLTLSVLCYAFQAFPEITPEMLLWMRGYRNNKRNGNGGNRK